jgi:hypothetical protein
MDIINVHTLIYYVFKMIEHKAIDYPNSKFCFLRKLIFMLKLCSMLTTVLISHRYNKDILLYKEHPSHFQMVYWFDRIFFLNIFPILTFRFTKKPKHFIGLNKECLTTM